MSNEQVAAWLAALPEIDKNEALTEIDNSEGGNGVVEVYEATQDEPRSVQIQVFYDDTNDNETTIKYVIFAPEAFSYYGTEIPAGWSLLEVVAESEEQFTMTVTPITARAEFDFGETVTVTAVSTKLSAINGEAIGIIEGEPVQTFDIEKVGTNCTISGSATIDEDETVTLTVTPASGYALPDDITVSKAEYVYDKDAGTIVLSEPTDAVYVEVVCTALMRSITANVTNGSATGATEIQDAIGTASVTIVPGSGYALPSSVSVSGASYTYDDTTGVISLSNATGGVTIEALCARVSLTPFAVGTSFQRIQVDPTAVSANDLATWLDDQSAGNVMEYTVPDVVTPTPWTIGTIDSKKALIIPLYQGTTAMSSPAQMVCVADNASYSYDDGNGATTLSLTKGWNLIISGDGTADSATAAAITEKSTYTLQESITATVTTLSEGFASINGEAVGWMQEI